jgi:hypothetical protein
LSLFFDRFFVSGKNTRFATTLLLGIDDLLIIQVNPGLREDTHNLTT